MNARRRAHQYREVANPSGAERNEETLTQAELKRYLEWQVQFLRELRKNINQEARDALVALDRHCDKDFLLSCLWRLGAHRPLSDDWEKLIGFDRRTVRKVAGRLRRCATEVEQLNGSVLGHFLYLPSAASGAELARLPEILRAYAAFIVEGPSRLRLQQRHRPVTTIVRAALIAHVVQRTETPHDSGLSALYNVTARKSISADSWKDWREAHQPLIARLKRANAPCH
jgi:hypothetical protein